MILVDTSVWVDHLRKGDARLIAVLEADLVLAHPCVIGELSLGGLRHDGEAYATLSALPRAMVASPDEVQTLIEAAGLAGTAIGYVDATLLAAARLTPETRLWTHDQRLLAAAKRLSLDARPQ